MAVNSARAAYRRPLIDPSYVARIRRSPVATASDMRT
jgi:hypothetical protein